MSMPLEGENRKVTFMSGYTEVLGKLGDSHFNAVAEKEVWLLLEEQDGRT